MAYNKTDWQNLPSTTTPLNATNLNKIENQLVKSDILNVAPNTISTGDNLNNYTTYGIYTSNTGTISASLLNTPITDSGFKLIVEYLHDTSRIRQTIYANSAYSYTYIRTYTQSGWGSWIKMPNYNIYEKPLISIESSSNLNNYTNPRNIFLS